MARVQIRLPEDFRETIEGGHMVAARHYEVLVDGCKIEGLIGVVVTWEMDSVPTATLDINVECLDIDALALSNLQLHVAQKEGA